MSVNMQSTKHAKWTTRMWRTLAALDEAISVSPMEHLEKRIAALEQEVWVGSEPPRTHKESKPRGCITSARSFSISASQEKSSAGASSSAARRSL